MKTYLQTLEPSQVGQFVGDYYSNTTKREEIRCKNKKNLNLSSLVVHTNNLIQDNNNNDNIVPDKDKNNNNNSAVVNKRSLKTIKSRKKREKMELDDDTDEEILNDYNNVSNTLCTVEKFLHHVE